MTLLRQERGFIALIKIITNTIMIGFVDYCTLVLNPLLLEGLTIKTDHRPRHNIYAFITLLNSNIRHNNGYG